MPAPKGHPKWGAAVCNKRFTAEELWEEFCKYTDWASENPWIKQDFIKGGDAAGNIVELKTERPLSIKGFCIFLGISFQTFQNYSQKEGYETTFEICSRIRDICDNQNEEGGLVGAFNASLVAMRLGLKQKNETTGTVINYNAEITKEEAKIISDALESQY